MATELSATRVKRALGTNPSFTTWTAKLLKSTAAGNVGVGFVTSTNISANGNFNFAVGTTDQVQLFNAANGSGNYTYNVDLDAANGAFEGAIAEINVVKLASTQPTIAIRNGIGGSNIASINSNAAQTWHGRFVFDGTAWKKLSVVISDA